MGFGNAIMVVDDDPGILEFMTAKLEGAGYKVVTANDADAAFRLAETIRPRLLISDYQMPVWGSGADLYQEIRKHPQLENVPVVFISGLPPAELKRAMEGIQRDPKVRLLTKPVNWVMLEQSIADLLGEHKPLG